MDIILQYVTLSTRNLVLIRVEINFLRSKAFNRWKESRNPNLYYVSIALGVTGPRGRNPRGRPASCSFASNLFNGRVVCRVRGAARVRVHQALATQALALGAHVTRERSARVRSGHHPPLAHRTRHTAVEPALQCTLHNKIKTQRLFTLRIKALH